MFGQWWPLVPIRMLRGVIDCFGVACVAGFELCELPWAEANATPPPVTASVTVPTATAALRPSIGSPFARVAPNRRTRS